MLGGRDRRAGGRADCHRGEGRGGREGRGARQPPTWCASSCATTMATRCLCWLEAWHTVVGVDRAQVVEREGRGEAREREREVGHTVVRVDRKQVCE